MNYHEFREIRDRESLHIYSRSARSLRFREAFSFRGGLYALVDWSSTCYYSSVAWRPTTGCVIGSVGMQAFDRRGGAHGTRLGRTKTCLATRLLAARGHGRLARTRWILWILSSREIAVLISNGSTLFTRVHTDFISLRHTNARFTLRNI